MKKMLCMAACVAFIATFAACGKSDKRDISDASATEAVTTTTMTTITTITEAETSAVTTETSVAETSENAAEITTSVVDITDDQAIIVTDVDDSDSLTIETTIEASDIPEFPESLETVETSETEPIVTESAETSVTKKKPSVKRVKAGDMFKFTFDGITYSLPISGYSLNVAKGWTEYIEPGKFTKSYSNDKYEGCVIDEIRRGGADLNGVSVSVIKAMRQGLDYPELTMPGGITWGSSEEDVIAAYGEPADTQQFVQYGTMTKYFEYRQSDGSKIFLGITEACGLALVEMYRF